MSSGGHVFLGVFFLVFLLLFFFFFFFFWNHDGLNDLGRGSSKKHFYQII